MPEITEVEKMMLSLNQAWAERRIIQITPVTTEGRSQPNPFKYLKNYGQGAWNKEITTSLVRGVIRHGKQMYVAFYSASWDPVWQIGLGQTGWFVPANDKAVQCCKSTPIMEHFIHRISRYSARLRFFLSDGQAWDYHDPRTWGRWLWFPRGMKDVLSVPDWLKDTNSARLALINLKSKRKVKAVLVDQKVAAGLGNYMACEILHRAGVSPRRIWDGLTTRENLCLGLTVETFLWECLGNNDHKHWKVFQKAGSVCTTCGVTEISYEKDSTGGQRGTYWCRRCQPMGIEELDKMTKVCYT